MEHEKHNEYLNILKMLDFTYERSRKYYFLTSLIEKVLNEDNKINIGFSMIDGFGLKYSTDKKDELNSKSNFEVRINILGCLINDIIIHSYSFIKYKKNNTDIIDHLKLSYDSINELLELNKIITSPQCLNNIIFKNDCQKLIFEIINYECEKYKNIDEKNYNFLVYGKNIKQIKVYRDLVSYNTIKITNEDFFNYVNNMIQNKNIIFTNNFNKYKNKILVSSIVILQSYYIFDELYDEILNNTKDEKRKEYIKNLIDKTYDFNKHEILQHLTFDELYNNLYY